MSTYQKSFLLFLLILLAFFLRWYLMPSHFFFGPEEGRDFLVVRDIVVNHKFTLIGPRTDIEGVFHGPLFYWLEAIPFSLSHGDPVAVLAFFILIQSMSVVLAYALAYELTKNRRTGLIAAAVFAVSYFCIVYARWLSHPALSVPFSMAFIFCLHKFIRGNHKYLVATAFMYGILGQVEFVNYLLFGMIGASTCLYYWKQLIKTNRSIIISALIVGVITSLATYVIFDLRHDFIVSNGLRNLLQGKGGFHTDFSASISGAFRLLMDTVSLVGGSYNWKVGLFVTIPLMAVWLKRTQYNTTLSVLAFWVWVPPIVFALLRHGMLLHFYAGVVAGFVILLALAIDWVWEKKRVVGICILAVVMIYNISETFQNLPNNNRVFFQIEQPAVRYTDQLAVIDWVYKEAKGRPFEFQAFTIPYFLPGAWIYLFDSYGATQYGYGPTAVNRKLLYVIVQKSRIDPLFQDNWYTKTVSTWGKKTVYTTIGEYMVEERVPE